MELKCLNSLIIKVVHLLLFFSLLITPHVYALSVKQRIKVIAPRVEIRIPSIIKKITHPKTRLTLAIFKAEQVVEIWQTQPQLIKLKTYPFTKFSGSLGPKNRKGDKQIPEGVYSIPLLNPASRFYLSARLNYPNSLDKKRAIQNGVSDPGDDIYIHGKDKTVGCIPIGDNNIEELFYILDKVQIKNVSVIIAPSKSPFYNLKKMGVKDSDHWGLIKYQKIKDALKKLQGSPPQSRAPDPNHN